MRARKRKSTLVDKYTFVTFVLVRLKLSIELSKKKSKGIGKKVKDKTLRDLGPADTTVHTRVDGLSVQLCGNSSVACKWINGECSLRQKYRGRIGQAQMTLHSWWKEKSAKPISMIDDFVKHVYREHNEEADSWANNGAQDVERGDRLLGW